MLNKEGSASCPACETKLTLLDIKKFTVDLHEGDNLVFKRDIWELCHWCALEAGVILSEHKFSPDFAQVYRDGCLDMVDFKIAAGKPVSLTVQRPHREETQCVKCSRKIPAV